jgi:hypothetical protein
MSTMNVIDSFMLDVNGAVSLASASPPLIGHTMSGKTVYRMVISVAGGPVGWRCDGTAPTAGTCHVIDDGGTLSLTGANYRTVIKAMQFIKTTAATAQIFGTAFD